MCRWFYFDRIYRNNYLQFVFLSVAITAVSAEQLDQTVGEAFKTACLPSARLRRMWRFPKHRKSSKPCQNRELCAPLRAESSQPGWLLCYLVRRSRIARWFPLRQQLSKQVRFPVPPRFMQARLNREIPIISIEFTSNWSTSFSAISIPATSYLDTSRSISLICTTSSSKTLAPLIPNNTHSLGISRNSNQSNQLKRLLSALKTRTLPLLEQLRKRLIKPSIGLNTSSLALNESRIHIASGNRPNLVWCIRDSFRTNNDAIRRFSSSYFIRRSRFLALCIYFDWLPATATANRPAETAIANQACKLA